MNPSFTHGEVLGARSARPEDESVRVEGKLTALSIGEEPAAEIDRALTELARLPYVASVLALPDVHQKASMEVPSSIAIATHDVIVPEFTSVAVNDGMGVVTTDLAASELTPEHLERFLTGVNAHSAAHVFDANRYSLTAQELLAAIVAGGRAVIGKYCHKESVLERMEWGGCIPVGEDPLATVRECVPWPLQKTRFSRCEMGLNFGGNHFLEVQAVEEVLDAAAASRWGLEKGQVVIMYHLGPGPFSGTLLHHYSRRSKLKGRRVPLFFLSKLLFHYLQRAGRAAFSSKWALHFRRNGRTEFPEASEEGMALKRAMAMAINFGFAYRLATVKAIQDGIHGALSAGVRLELLCDISHNGIFEESLGGRRAWVARHNACRLVPGKPTIVAGSYDVPSYLGVGGDGSDGWMHSYDHGAGNLIEGYRESGRLTPTSGSVARFRMSRGKSGRVIARANVPMRTAQPIDRLMECLEQNQIMRPVVRLRPLANLKN